jgi:uncharacterized protein (DUF427 family)
MRLAALLLRTVRGRRHTGRVRAVWNGAVLAESDRTIRLEGHHYFPPDSVDRRYLQPSSHATLRRWKGVASYYDVEVGGSRLPAAAWCYPEPSPAAAAIKDHVAFWLGVPIVRIDEDERRG